MLPTRSAGLTRTESFSDRLQNEVKKMKRVKAICVK